MDLEYRVGGAWEIGQGGEVFADTSPSDTRRVLAHYRLMSSAQASRAVEAGLAAFAGWRALSPIARGVIMQRAATVLRERGESIARDIAEENGKLLPEARMEVDKSADFLDFYGSTARLSQGRVLADPRLGTHAWTMIEPLGLVAAITPWNDPMLTPARKLGPALICGNTVILKPARETPLAALHLVRALADAGLPAGVLNTVMTEHAVFDAAVLDHPGLAAVTFTGSTSVGLSICRKLAGRTVRTQTEMGGKNASVVLADADLKLAASVVLGATFGQAGQRCTATSRLIVESSVSGEFVRLLCEAVQGLKLGSSLDTATKIGPVVSRRHHKDVLSHIERTKDSGARIVCGGGAPGGEELSHGCFIEPTIVTGVTRRMPIWREEVFGPVLAVHEVSSFADAVDAVNDSSYGLSAALFTSDLRAAHRFLAAADVGQVAVNLPTSGWDVHQPFGGFKESGSPFKEQGLEGTRFYTRTKMGAIRFDW
jgi:alpha-ketoglutaric semialdehyde dehydrogenase